MPEIAILTPVFNKLKLTIKCLESLIRLIDPENFPQYHGDSDYTYRAKLRGYKIMVHPQLKLWNDSLNTGINHEGEISKLLILLKDQRSLYHFREKVLFLRRFSTSYLAYWPLLVSCFRLFGGFFKWKLLCFVGLKRKLV